MTSLNISLPEPLKSYVESKVASGDYSTPSEYLRELIRQDKQGHLQHLEMQLTRAARAKDFALAESDLQPGMLVRRLREKVAQKK